MERRDSAMSEKSMYFHPDGQEALVELLFQLADDDFLLAYRGSEWLGLAPHIEEDIAFSSINQDTMGHAAMYYQLLEEFGLGTADELAHARPATERRNAVLLELPNGPGHYLREPRYDWAFTVVRQYFYTQAKRIRLESLRKSAYKPLAEVAAKVQVELHYHLLHWHTWFVQLTNAPGEARTRMIKAIQDVAADFAGVLTLGARGAEMERWGLIEGEDVLTEKTIAALAPAFAEVGLEWPMPFGMKHGNGRNGEHTPDLDDALATLSEVYRSVPQAIW
ncbi:MULTISPECIES: 1,2-phenylacetyl-CoA epoxidase subunit PaaC [Geobacillus]|jgi:ring-1,2-phenylacetyl-CoA epoxidase subunit PaaC|uniref:1,2-phenylacetyl-CoA epoxidase subunit PaaC n=1 Tax=Geobacillus TaxID=129337 RepID=UPI000760C8A3|nr:MULTISPECIES: 1,2-phenylacetyl-CoA epoxidase subunit PaaC [Geobacillus]MED0662058.1 phenylacetate-CoA oxygenase subunit PaaI [Geobacillus thermodenitrificans]MED4916240.1 phenylacetate-CoA oxygenase subunit PaaC [Geobacillus thermodenitrificans]NNU88232.1 phenylacetate-CoA oxygenase subunit PaaI [Geobacillus sp. MR]PTR45689.1 phenylacetate-CoA oxygenase subunit PaaI [Geobacillus thermodenitrificans]